MTDNQQAGKPDKSYLLCAVYKGGPDEQTFLFVDHSDGLERVPEQLREKFLEPILVTQFKLSSDRKLAQADAALVMRSIKEKGFYLQLPPPKDFQLAAMAAKNDKLPV